MTTSASPYISAVSMCVMPASMPRRSAAMASARFPSRFQVPWPMIGRFLPVEPKRRCCMRRYYAATWLSALRLQAVMPRRQSFVAAEDLGEVPLRLETDAGGDAHERQRAAAEHFL